MYKRQTEAGSLASWIAAGTSYAHTGVPMVPFYIFYSMFGLQRVGDLVWAAGDSRARGFLLAATAGRTTLEGEGLQHQDGHSLVLASTFPSLEAYDPAFAYEMGTIIRHGLHRMYGKGDDNSYYLTLYNENYQQPKKPEGINDGIIAGMYRFAEAPAETRYRTTILFSGSAHTAAREAQKILFERYGVGAELWSVTSYKKLREEALEVERWNRLHPGQERRAPLVSRLLALTRGPIVAVTDYMHAVPDQISRWAPRRFITLGTDGYGRSDTREAVRRFFETDEASVTVAALSGLVETGEMEAALVDEAIRTFGLDPDSAAPWTRDA